MPKTCQVCRHPKREEIDQALTEGVALRTISDQYGPSKTGLIRHREHIPVALTKATEAKAVSDADDLLGKIRRLETDAFRIKDQAERAGNLRTALAGVRELLRIVELLAKLRGELANETNVNILATATMPKPNETADAFYERLCGDAEVKVKQAFPAWVKVEPCMIRVFCSNNPEPLPANAEDL